MTKKAIQGFWALTVVVAMMCLFAFRPMLPAGAGERIKTGYDLTVVLVSMLIWFGGWMFVQIWPQKKEKKPKRRGMQN